MWACLLGQSNVVSKLLALPMGNVHAKNKAGSTALDIACGLKIVELSKCREEHAKESFRYKL